MLRELKIENLAIIDELDLEFQDGFIVLTGETGAGKSIILSAINLLIGEKASVDMIRDGEEQLFAQGVFGISEKQKNEIEKLGIESEDNEVIVRRYFARNAKGKVYINNVRVSLSELKVIMGTLVDIVGQHSHQMLLNKENHIKLLDEFLGEKAERQKVELLDICENYKDVKNKIKNVEDYRKESIEKRDFYEYQISEIDNLNLSSGEDVNLEEEYKILFNAGKIKDKLETALYALNNGEINALNSVRNSKKTLDTISNYGQDFKDVITKLDSIYYDLSDCIDIINTINSSLDIDDIRLAKISERLDSLNKIKNKYSMSIEQIIDYRNEIYEKLLALDGSDFDLTKLTEKKEALEKRYFEKATELSLLRKEVSKKIEANLSSELKFLNMKDAVFEVKITSVDKIRAEGIDDVEFMIATNVGQSLKPLSKIASGGEVSRIMLALKVIFSAVDNIPILIFDEIDTGVGGETVRKIGDKLKEIGRNTQIISITHSPSIAAKAKQQFYIVKSNKDGRTITNVKKLNEEERVSEIARMLAGENISDSVIKLSKEMLYES